MLNLSRKRARHRRRQIQRTGIWYMLANAKPLTKDEEAADVKVLFERTFRKTTK